jgi:hypothetical protein
MASKVKFICFIFNFSCWWIYFFQLCRRVNSYVVDLLQDIYKPDRVLTRIQSRKMFVLNRRIDVVALLVLAAIISQCFALSPSIIPHSNPRKSLFIIKPQN